MSQQPSPLSLKVMRLSKPSFSKSQCLGLDLVQDVLLSDVTETLKSTYTQYSTKFGVLGNQSGISPGSNSLYLSPFTEKLLLPKDFGTLFLGEPFVCQFLLTNESQLDLNQIKCTIEIQSTSQKTLLFKNYDSPGGDENPETEKPESNVKVIDLGSRQIYNFQTKYETKELGLHVLLCTTEYLQQGIPKILKRSFKFYVENPIVVKTKVNHIPQNPDSAYLEVQIQTAPNIKSCMLIQKFQLEPSSDFDVIDLNKEDTFYFEDGIVTNSSNPSLNDTFAKSTDPSASKSQINLNNIWQSNFIDPDNTRQYLYLLVPKATTTGSNLNTVDNLRRIRYLSTLGKLNIIWAWSFGSTGRLQTSHLIRNSPGLHLIEVSQIQIHAANYGSNSLEKSMNQGTLTGTDIQTKSVGTTTVSICSLSRSIVRIEETFQVSYTLVNTSEYEMNIVVELDTRTQSEGINDKTASNDSSLQLSDPEASSEYLSSSIIISGQHEFDFGAFLPGESRSFEASYLSLDLGAHSLGALRIKDIISGYSREILDVCSVFVID
ncbi:hypothetical protein BB560_002047 [Smittium megazygosporum]|uniref:Trafficking protein particle complex subunit 13 n=1 Tax=Smittium megazygosporum TaxID=133381 RepID=A0A2T9ZFT7_9FUNG|nr:hypothetical protein BB560_002047 [Smittium megazygosporum]